jgi:putative ABC transport system permease protein
VTLLRFGPYVVKTVWRARMRSLLTVIGTALALAMFAFVRTLEGGVHALEASASTPTLVVFQQSRFCPLTSELPLRYKSDIQGIDGVEAVLPVLLYINACRSNLDLVTLHGVDPAALDAVEPVKVVSGDLQSWRGVANGAIVGKRLAERRKVSPGDALRLGNVDVQVSGIFEAEGAGLDNVAFVHDTQLQQARGKLGKATQFNVKLKPGADPAAVAAAIDRRLATDEAPTDTKTMQAFVQGAIGEIAGIVSFARLLGWLAVAVVVLVLGNTVFISAQTRAAELGTLEAVGLPKTSLAALLLAESCLLAVVGGAIGTGLVVLWFHLKPTTLGVEGMGIDFEAGLPVLVAGLVASLGVGVVAAIGPMVEALRRPLAVAVKAA